MPNVLDEICAKKRLSVEARKAAKPLDALKAEMDEAGDPRGFKDALAAKLEDGDYGLIAEVKKASPSKGLIRADFDPVAIGQAYERAGAACISVLTDEPYFQGSDEYLKAVHKAVKLPVLRKDFMVDPYQIYESRALGADCVLLILAALDDATAFQLEETAHRLGMDVLIEVHDEAEAERAMNFKSPLVGINNRNLKTLEVSLKTAEALIPRMPNDKLIVCESGLSGPMDLARMAACGCGLFLIGESLMRQADVEAATRELLADAAPVERRGIGCS